MFWGGKGRCVRKYNDLPSIPKYLLLICHALWVKCQPPWYVKAVRKSGDTAPPVVLSVYGGSWWGADAGSAIGKHPLGWVRIYGKGIRIPFSNVNNTRHRSFLEAVLPVRRKRLLSETTHPDACLRPVKESGLPKSQKHLRWGRNRNCVPKW